MKNDEKLEGELSHLLFLVEHVEQVAQLSTDLIFRRLVHLLTVV